MRNLAGRVVRILITLCLAVSGALVLQVATPPPAAAAEIPWLCGDAAYLFQSPNNTAAPHLVESIDLVTGQSTNVGTTANLINAVGFNELDNFMYAWNLQTDTLNRVSSDLSLINLGVPAGTPVPFRGIDYNVGDFDDAGHLWIMDNQTGRWLEIDLNPGPGFNTSLASGIIAAPAGLLLPGDWAYVNGQFYAVAPTTSGTGNARLLSFNPATRTFTNLGELTGMASGSTFGAVYSDGTFLYVSRNQGGNIYRVDPATVTNIFLSTGPASSSNDGARCRSNVIPTVTLVKQVDGRLQTSDQFRVSLVAPSGAIVAQAETTGAQTSVSTVDQPVERGVTYFINDDLVDGSGSTAEDYTASISCTGDGLLFAAPELEIAHWSLTITDRNAHLCVITNTPDPPDPELTLVKSVSPSDAASFVVDAVLTYTFVVTNTGNVPISSIAVDETAFSGTGTPTPAVCAATTLLPREQTTCTSTYTVTQDDIDAGELTNTAQATGDDPGGGDVTSNEDSAEIPSDPSPALTLEKSALPTLATAAGQTIDYTYVVTNTGNVTVDEIAIGEVSFTGSGAIGAATCTPTTLLPGLQATCTATYTVTQDDIDAGASLVNVATATGSDPGGDPVTSPEDDADVDVAQTAALSMTKTAEPTTVSALPATITYTYTVTNQGNLTIDDLAIVEDSFSGTGTMSATTCLATLLAPQADTTCTSTYDMTQADFDAGAILNVAHAAGTSPQDEPVISPPDNAVVGVVPVQGLTLAKSVSAATSPVVAGVTLTYTFLVTNTGNQTIENLTIQELTFTGTGTMGPIACPATELAPAANTTCTSTYVVTDADVTAGTVDNLAVATGNGPGGQTTSNQDDASQPIPPAEQVLPDDVDTADDISRDVGGGLATTGSALGPWVLPLGLLLIAGGTGLVLASSLIRRRSTPPSGR